MNEQEIKQCRALIASIQGFLNAAERDLEFLNEVVQRKKIEEK